MDGQATILLKRRRRGKRPRMAKNRNGVSYQVYINNTLNEALMRLIGSLAYDPGVSPVFRKALIKDLRSQGFWTDEDDRRYQEEEATKAKRGPKPKSKRKGKGE